MRIIQIFEKNYPENKKVVFEYTSNFYYKLKSDTSRKRDGWIFEWEKTAFTKTFRKKLKGNFFESYKGNAEYYILVNSENFEIGLIAFEHQSHSNRTRIWDIMIHSDYQRNGHGTFLMNFTCEKAKNLNSRALVLECQNTNVKAIDFYLKNGFNLIGFDLEAYTEEQGGGIEARFEMSKNLR